MPFPFPDALNQFSVESSVLGAQDGINSGGKVNAVTRSGTNSYHGNAFEFLRNNYINARNFFSAVPDSLHQNQFGGTFGGPIIRNKLFAFAGYQRLQASQSSSPTAVRLPTAANLLGDFSVTDPVAGTKNNCSSTGVNLLDPLTGTLSPATSTPPRRPITLLRSPSSRCSPRPRTRTAAPTRTPSQPAPPTTSSSPAWTGTSTTRTISTGATSSMAISSRPCTTRTTLLVTTQSGNLERFQSLTFGENWAISSKR